MTATIKVWDVFIRVFHWSLVIAFVVSYFTEGENNLHFYSGWFIALLLVTRIVWGFVGGKYARFVDFIRSPAEIVQYSRTLLLWKRDGAKRYLGHNPLGGLMIIALLTSLSLTCIGGVMLYNSEAPTLFSFVGEPILAEPSFEEHNSSVHEAGKEDSFWKEFHELFANLTLLLIFIHIAGVLVSSRFERENLAKSMITGNKSKDSA